jgi:H/ACA ribonucleoprotein complex subunit 4
MRLHKDINEEKIKETCDKFIGEIYQIPPVRSAVKREKRKKRIYYINILEIDGREVLFHVGCEAGTYIRTLCVDIGKEISCGAHLEELRRTKTGKFEEKDSVTLHDLLDSYIFWKENGIEEWLRRVLKPMEFLLDHLPKIIIRDSAVDAICHGANLAIPGILRVDDQIKLRDTVAIETLKGEGVALAKSLMTAREMIQKDSGIAANINRVLMNKGTYPPIWRKS